ncbi:hypothetical protein C0J52_08446 [Blattella germanica]|nr:hypothetical protein C0J52_08446 [Blattella germanica]
MPYCEDDYANLFLKRCAACNKPIKEKVVVALEREWHEDHFVCSSCGKKLAGANFFEKDGAPYCQSDYNNLFAPKCNYCKRPITDAAIMALGEKYHQECFKCSVSATSYTPCFKKNMCTLLQTHIFIEL